MDKLQRFRFQSVDRPVYSSDLLNRPLVPHAMAVLRPAGFPGISAGTPLQHHTPEQVQTIPIARLAQKGESSS